MAIPQSIEHFLGDHQVPYSVLHHTPAYTAQQEAAVAHVPGWGWAKTVVCFADGRPILVVLPAPSLVDFKRLREVVGARDIRLASEQELAHLYPDCETGTMPPFGPLYGQPVYVDRSLAGGEEIVFNAGSHSDAIKVKYDDFVRVVQPILGDFSRSAHPETTL